MLDIGDAEHAEYGPDVSTPLITPVSCPVPGGPEGAPKLSGKLKIRVHPDSLAFRIYRRREVKEEFFCNFELNRAFQARIDTGGLRVVGQGENGDARIVELPRSRFFVATLFLPQLASRRGRSHPLITAYLEAVLSFRGPTRKI